MSDLRLVLRFRHHHHCRRVSGRICHAVELSPVYVDHGGSLAGTGKVARLDSDGRAFAAVAAERGIPLGREAYGAAQTSLSRS